MKKAIRIQIPEPCHEDWQKMTPTEKGKFCGVCTKEVIDFSTKADEDLVKILSKSNNLCGRFKKSQLNREVKLERKSGYKLAPYAASLLLPLSLLSTNEVSSNKSNASDKPLTSLGIGRFSTPIRAIIHTVGKVMDASGNPLADVLIMSNESKKQVKSDHDGKFTITTMDHEILSFQKDGFQSQEIELGKSSSEKNISMVSEIYETSIMGGLSEVIIIEEQLTSEVVEIENVCEKISDDEVSEIEDMGDIIQVEEISEAIIIKGTVTDEFKLPLPGVNVIIKGTSIGTQSDFDGNYSIETKANQTLQFSYVGFDSKDIQISNISNNINVQLEEGDFLGGIVVVGIMDWDGDPIEPVDTKLLDEENRREWKAAIKKASENERAFKRIKLARKKAARKLKRSQRK